MTQAAVKPETRTRTSQLTYGSGNLQLSLALRPRALGPRLEVDGALVDRFESSAIKAPAYLLRGSRVLEAAETDERGVFHMQPGLKEGLRICLILEDDRLVELEMGHHHRSGRQESRDVKPTSRSC